jgi:predicted GNAT family acetyltransferase
VGPFVATFSPGSTNEYLNYAIPDPGAAPTRDDAVGLVTAFARRGRRPRVEYLPGQAPAVEPALLAAGFTVQQRVPLMVCSPGELVEQPMPPGIELLTPGTDEEIVALRQVQRETFGDSDPVTPETVAGTRRALAQGSLAVLAREAGTGEIAGGGGSDPVSDAVAELVGFAVREKQRRRGIGGAITTWLTREAYRAGAQTVFLTPGGSTAERMYARAGFRTVDEVLFLVYDGRA